jgi:hypothetical protein
VTQPAYPLPLYPFYYIFSFIHHLLQFSIRPNFPFPIFICRTIYYCDSLNCHSGTVDVSVLLRYGAGPNEANWWAF